MGNAVGSDNRKAVAASNSIEHRIVGWNNTLPDTSLVIDDEPARLCQADFSRLQAALGLKLKTTAEGKTREHTASRAVRLMVTSSQGYQIR
jgi:hypothetical protein